MIKSSQLTVMSIKEFLFSRNIKIIFYYFIYRAITIFISVIFQNIVVYCPKKFCAEKMVEKG